MDKLLLPTSIVGAGVCLLFSMSAVVVLGCYKYDLTFFYYYFVFSQSRKLLPRCFHRGVAS